MRRCLITVLALAAAILVDSQSVHAGSWDSIGAESSDGHTSVSAYSGPVFGFGGSGGSGPTCRWERLFYDREPGAEFTEGDIPVSPTGAGELASRELNGVEYTAFRMSCPDGTVQDRWVRTGVTVADLIPEVRAYAEGIIAAPVPVINPPADVGGLVNLGLWLGVQEQSFGPLSAEAGAVWITLSPRLAGSRFEFGNGDSVSCDGIGVRIEDVHPDLDVMEESPTCGYTYQRSSPDDHPYRLTVVTLWELPYQSSSGPGSLPVLERSVTLAYDVDEVQTLGTRN